MNHFKIIETERLIIDKLTPNDSEAFFNYRSKPEICQFQSFNPKKLEDAIDFINNIAEYPNKENTWYQVGIFIKRNNQLIGDIGIHFLDDEQIEIGYTIDSNYQGLGYAYESLKAIMHYLFIGLNKHRITASVDPNNEKSIKLLNRLNFRKEAHFIKSLKINNQWFDDCIYALLKEEWM